MLHEDKFTKFPRILPFDKMSLSIVLLFGFSLFLGIHGEFTPKPCTHKWIHARNFAGHRRYFIPVMAANEHAAEGNRELFIEIYGTTKGLDLTMTVSPFWINCTVARKINVTFDYTPIDHVSYDIFPGEEFCQSHRSVYNISVIEFNLHYTLGFVKKCNFNESMNFILLVDCAYKWHLENNQKGPIDWIAEAKRSFGDDEEMMMGFAPVQWDAQAVLNTIRKTKEYSLNDTQKHCKYLRDTKREIVPDQQIVRFPRIGIFVIVFILALFMVVGIMKTCTGSSPIYPIN